MFGRGLNYWVEQNDYTLFLAGYKLRWKEKDRNQAKVSMSDSDRSLYNIGVYREFKRIMKESHLNPKIRIIRGKAGSRGYSPGQYPNSEYKTVIAEIKFTPADHLIFILKHHYSMVTRTINVGE